MRSAFSIAGLLLASAVAAQVQPGQSVATVINATTTQGEMFFLDHQTRTVKQLTLSTALATDRPNCVLMTTPVTGFVGTNPLPANTPANVYAITIAGTTVTETKLNTTATAGGNAAQIAPVGSTLYFTTQNATGAGGILQSVPVAGGPVTSVLDLTTLTGYVGLCNACCAIGTKVYTASFDSGTTAVTGCVTVHDTVANTHAVLAQLPKGKGPSGTSFLNPGIVYMYAVANKLHLIGVYGDKLVMDAATGAVDSHEFTGGISGTTSTINLTNSGAHDAATGDVIAGSRDGACDRWAGNGSAEKTILGVGSSATPTSNSVTGMAHFAATTTATDTHIGDGCRGSGGMQATDAAAGLPSAGNANYALALYAGTGGDGVICFLAVGDQKPPLDLGGLGMTGCNLHLSGIAASIAGTLTGTGNGTGTLTVPLPLPASAAGFTLYRQWAEVQLGTKSNPLGVVMSNARRMAIK